MKKIILPAAFGVMLLFAASSFAKQNYWKVDKSHSTIGFTVKHLGLSKVHGYFDEYEAWVTRNSDNRASNFGRRGSRISSQPRRSSGACYTAMV